MSSLSDESLARDANEIMRSGFVRSSWYAATYPDVPATGLRASEHYLSVGARLGRDPSPLFRTRFYEETSGDLIEPGENPLLSYLRRGRAQGRAAREEQQMAEVARLTQHLWGRNSAAAAERLEAIAVSPRQGQQARYEALRQLAARRDFDGDPEEAARLLASMRERTPRWATCKGALMRRGVLAARMGEAGLARACFERVPPKPDPEGLPEPDADALLALAGLEEDGAARLAALSAVLKRRGYEPLRLRDPAGPVSLANLAAAPAPRALPPMGTVSVIVPAFNAAGSLEPAVRSLLAQSYPELEILVVDDASPDDTFAVARRLAAGDPRVRPLRAERNGGAYAARNLGLAHATGAFITTHDADDWSHPRKIEVQLRAFLRNPRQAANAVTWARVREDLRPTTNWRLSDLILHMSYSSIMLRREVAEHLGPWDEVRTGGDTEYLWRLWRVLGRRNFDQHERRAPLAFALDEASSLTRAKATHVVSNYHGMRLVYREAARHHLRAARDPLDPEARAAHLRRVPPEMRGEAPPPGPLDLRLQADLFDPVAVAAMAKVLAEARWKGARVGIQHEPELASDPRGFARALWRLVDGERVRLLVDEPAPGDARATIRVQGRIGERVTEAARVGITPSDDEEEEHA